MTLWTPNFRWRRWLGRSLSQAEQQVGVVASLVLGNGDMPIGEETDFMKHCC